MGLLRAPLVLIIFNISWSLKSYTQKAHVAIALYLFVYFSIPSVIFLPKKIPPSQPLGRWWRTLPSSQRWSGGDSGADSRLIRLRAISRLPFCIGNANFWFLRDIPWRDRLITTILRGNRSKMTKTYRMQATRAGWYAGSADSAL